MAEAEPELEKLVRSGYRTVVAFPRRGEGERAAYNLGRMKASWLGEDVDAGRQVLEPSLRFAAASLREGFVAPQLKLAVFPEHRLLRRRRAERAGARAGRGAGRGAPGGVRRGALRSFTELRTGDIVVHEDHGVARFAGFETRTVADVTRDYLYLEYQGDDRVFVPTEQLAKISRYVGARRRAPAAVEARRHALGDDEGARAPRGAGARGGAAEPLRRAPPPRRLRVRARLRLAARVRAALPVHRDAPTSWRRSNWSRPTWKRRGRWIV